MTAPPPTTADPNYANLTKTILKDVSLVATAFSEQDPDLPATLFGRVRETSVLVEAFQRVRHNKFFEVVTVHGESGCGKSALVVEALRTPVRESNGYFCTGKYFQSSGVQEPYAAIMDAFADLCDLVLQSDAYNERRRREIAQKLSLDGPLLMKSISKLAPLLSGSSQVRENVPSRNNVALAKFEFACKTFLQAMSSKEHPVVLFLDDIQWMDAGSRQLLRTLFLLGEELENVMLVLAYRQEEAETVHTILKGWRGSAWQKCSDIELGNLCGEAVNEIVAEALDSCTESTRSLSEVIMRMTAGNAFHVMHFTETLNREGLLVFDEVASSWIYDELEIQRKMSATDTLTKLLRRKVNLVSPKTIETLKVASLMGFSFTEELLADVFVMRTQINRCTVRLQITNSLREAMDERFVKRTPVGFEFSHDKIQYAFASLVLDDEEQILRSMIGEAYLLVDEDDSIYHAAVHLNRSSLYGRVAKKRMRLVEINLEASKFCSSKSAFEQASDFMRRGLAMLDSETMWKKHQGLAMEMTLSLSKLKLIIGDYTACIELLSQALLHSESIESKVRCLLTAVECRMATNEVSQAVRTGTVAIRLCGVNMPDKVSLRHVVFKLLKVRRLTRGNKVRDILALPIMQDKLMPVVIEILFHISGICLLKDDENRAVYSALLATELTFQYGLSPYSASALAVYGIAEASLGRIQRGYRLGKLAIDLQNHLKNKDSECPTVSLALCMLIHWKEPFRELRGTLDACLDSAYEQGDNVHGIFCSCIRFGQGAVMGDKLNVVEAQMRFNYSRFSSLSKDDGFVLMLQPGLQFVLNMQKQGGNDWASLCDLTGEIMNEPEYMRQVARENNVTFEIVAHIFKSMLAYHFGMFTLVEPLYEKMTPMANGVRCSPSAMQIYFFGGLTFYERYRNAGHRKLLRRARHYSNLLRRAESIGPNPNATACVTFLTAVEASVHKSSSPTLLSAKFDEAIEQLSSEKQVHFEAMACERAGFVFAGLGLLDEAEGYFERSMELYRYSWGAAAKYEWLKVKADNLLFQVRAKRRIDVSSRLVEIIEELRDEESIISGEPRS